MLKHPKPRNASFTLDERLALLKILKTKIKLVDSHMNDSSVNETKKEAWVQIQKQFVQRHPERHGASPKDIRELWRRMKHRARMEVRQKVHSAKRGAIPTLNDEHMGWMSDNNHTVVDINDLGLEPDTKAITEFVPLLEEEATVLETRNGVLQEAGDLTSSVPQDEGSHSDADFDYAEVEEIVDEDIPEVVSYVDHRVKTEPSASRELDNSPHFMQEREHVLHAIGLNHHQQPPTPPPLPPPSSSRSHEAVVVAEHASYSPGPPPPIVVGSSNKDQELAELSAQFLAEQHQAKMALIKMKQDAARAKIESARAKRSAYDEKRMFYFDKRKKLLSEDNNGV